MVFGLGVTSPAPVTPTRPLLGHASPHSLTSRLRFPADPSHDATSPKSITSFSASPSSRPSTGRSGGSAPAIAINNTRADPTWPEYLRKQQNAKSVVYESPRHGDITLQLATPSQPAMGAHFVWDSSLMMAELMAEDLAEWGVEGKRVLELGTGTGIASIVAALCGAKEVVASDYPDSRLLGNTRANIAANLRKGSGKAKEVGKVDVAQHLWGCVDDALARENAHAFDVIIAAGCLFLEAQHVNIAKSMAHFLKKDPDATVYVVSGFFLGRDKLENFFQIAFEEGLSVITMFEQDATGERRDCYVDCPDSKEEIMERGWLMIAQIGWHVEDEDEEEDPEEEMQIEFKNLDNGTTKKARPKSMLVRG